MKTIKIIDLLNKIANGEKLPKLKLEHTDDNDIGYELYIRLGDSSEYDFYKCLNDEVEIIEEKKEIKRLELDTALWVPTRNESNITENLRKTAKKLNEVIDAINELKKKGE